MKITIILGTRPEIIKLAPVIRELKRRQVDFFILHTGQHNSYDLDKVFFEQLELREAQSQLRDSSSTGSNLRGGD